MALNDHQKTEAEKFLAKSKAGLRRGRGTVGNTCDVPEVFTKPEGDLDELEKAGLLCVLHTLSLQLNILHARTSDSSRQSSTTSAKRLGDIIEKTIAQLQESGTFEFLHTTVEEECIKRWSDARVERNNVGNERRVHQMQIQIRKNKKTRMRDMNKKKEIIALLKDEVQNLIAKSECKMSYVDRWKTAQQEENLMKCENAEMELKWQLESLNDQYKNEIVVNEKTCAFLSEQTGELHKEFDEWKKRYHSEMSRRTEKINELQRKAREQKFRLQELKELFNERQHEMENYLKFKEERRAEEEQERFINDSATKIQAWWRGTMVRRCLGPYKRRKKIAKDKKRKGK